MDQTLYSVSRQPPSIGTGKPRPGRFPDASGDPSERRRVDAEPGAKCVAVPVPRRPRARVADAGRRHARQVTRAPSRRALEGGGAALLGRLTGVHRLLGQLLYGTGLRIIEGVRLRVKDVDPSSARSWSATARAPRIASRCCRRLVPPLGRHLPTSGIFMNRTCAMGSAPYGCHALARKYPGAARDWRWQYVFPADRRSVDPRTGIVRRHHVNDQSLQRAMREALRDTRIVKPRRRTRCATRSPRTCSNRATTSAPCRNCSATRTSARR